MRQISVDTIWKMSTKEFLHLLENSSSSRRRMVRFYAPGFVTYKTIQYSSSATDFPTISITGKSCALNCRHCSKKVLETMYPVTDPQELVDTCSRLKTKGARGFLISGGCTPGGSVPLANFTDAIQYVKRELGAIVLVHTGIIDYEDSVLLRNAGIDTALIDIVGSNRTIREVLGLSRTTDDFSAALDALSRAGLAFVPHVIVGLQFGKLEGELDALKMILPYNPSAIVIIAFMPIRGTHMEKVKPPEPADIARVILIARDLFPKTPLVLGCMRPRTDRRITERLSIEAGIDAIAFPSQETIEFVEENGIDASFSSLCCSQVYADILNR